jgi:serine protease Do
MFSDQDLQDKLEQYANGTLPPEERALLERKMQEDESFRIKADEHLKFISSLRQFASREKVKKSLEEWHLQLDASAYQVSPKKNVNTNYWSLIAVAASVALFCVVGTLLIMQSMKPDERAAYLQLNRKFDNIQNSQRVMMEDIADINKELKEKAPPPGDYAGTGFAISANGYIATSYHVVKGADSVYIENPVYGRLKTSIFITDQGNDIAILKIEDSVRLKSLPYIISTIEADLGENVFTLGFPREDIVYGDGTVSASTGFRQQISAYQITVPVNPGNSGGPLLNEEGNLIGMISGMQTKTAGAAFAIKSPMLLNVIQSVPPDLVNRPLQLPRTNRLKGYNRVQQIKKIREFVFVVKVYNKQ